MSEHIKILDFLRGVAALAVVLFHFGSCVLPTVDNNYFSSVLHYGQYGVQVFFVISGFIIPYSMYKSNYTIRNYFKQLGKRIVRINPPFYVSMILSFILYFSAIIIVGRPIEGMDWPGIGLVPVFGNLTFTVPFLDTMWYNPVYWTLGIEFQFYVIIGLFLPLVITKNKFQIISTILVILGVNFLGINGFFSFSGLFILGLLLFLKKKQLIDQWLFITLSVVASVSVVFQRDWIELLFGLSAYGLILSNINLDFKLSSFIGKISYSLYITHWAVGLMAEIALKRIIHIHDNPIGKIIMLLVYTAISILFATIFYRYVEKPFIQFSKKISSNLKN